MPLGAAADAFEAAGLVVWTSAPARPALVAKGHFFTMTTISIFLLSDKDLALGALSIMARPLRIIAEDEEQNSSWFRHPHVSMREYPELSAQGHRFPVSVATFTKEGGQHIGHRQPNVRKINLRAAPVGPLSQIFSAMADFVSIRNATGATFSKTPFGLVFGRLGCIFTVFGGEREFP